jgi:hypothetical protein
LISTLSFAARDLGGQRVQPRCPEPAKCAEPFIDVTQRVAVYRIKPPLSIRANRCKPVVSQHFEMLRDSGLADRELVSDDGTDGTRRHLTVGEQFEDSAPHRITEDVERVHTTKLK